MKAKTKSARKSIGKKSPMLVVLRALAIILAVAVVAAGGYLGYVYTTYSRIEDNVALSTENNSKFDDSGKVESGKTYRIVTNNLGFGAYSYDFDFFMDGGHESWAFSEDAVYKNLNGEVNKVLGLEPDFFLAQEIDIDATRTYHINELDFVNLMLDKYCYTFAYNYYNSPFFAIPVYQPHGSITAGLATYSKYPITEGVRRSLPIMDSFSKYFDLDRCYSVSRISVENGKELVIYNAHLSAYGSDDSVREGQTSMLFNDMLAEYERGNYVICGGDFNHNLLLPEGSGEFQSWAYPFPRSAIPEHLTLAMDVFGEEFKNTLAMSCRDCDEPYEKGHTTEFIVDGFIVSDNITVETYEILNSGYLYSDHEPVLMTFKLN